MSHDKFVDCDLDGQEKDMSIEQFGDDHTVTLHQSEPANNFQIPATSPSSRLWDPRFDPVAPLP